MLASHWLLDESLVASQWLGGLVTIVAIFIYYHQGKDSVSTTGIESDHI